MIYLVRHGETIWNMIGRQQGHLDSPLTQRGIDQARAAGRLLKKILPEASQLAIETSPLERARQTAAIVCQELGLSVAAVVISPLLIEHHLGNWHGLTWEEIEEEFPGSRLAREANKWTYRVPGGESYALIKNRARQWLESQRHAPITITVTHEMLSRTIQGAHAQLTPDETLGRNHPHDRIYLLHEGKIDEIHC